MKKYMTGSRSSVLRYMAECAIRDRVALIDALTPREWETMTPEAQAAVADCRASIADFRRLAGVTPTKRAAAG